jgi:DNA polymerase III subunit gamma/tau
MSAVQTFANKYRPQHLKDVFGQKHITDYFRSVVSNPVESPKSYILTGGFGMGKTTISRAFANDITGLDNVYGTPYAVEFDSFTISDKSVYKKMRDLIFQPVPGWKVVTFDEAHLIAPEVQGGMLKDIEESDNIFFFFCTTEREGILDTIYSRSIDFTLRGLTQEQLVVYLDSILDRQSLNLSDKVKRLLILRSRGHLRDLVNGIQLVVIMGEESYVESYVDTDDLLRRYFASGGFDEVEELIRLPYGYVMYDLSVFMYERVIKEQSIISVGKIPKLFTFYLKMRQYINDDGDYASFLRVLKEYVLQLRG